MEVNDAKMRSGSAVIFGFGTSFGECMGCLDSIELSKEEDEGIYRGVVGMGLIRGVERKGCAHRFCWGLCAVMIAKVH